MPELERTISIATGQATCVNTPNGTLYIYAHLNSTWIHIYPLGKIDVLTEDNRLLVAMLQEKKGG